MKKPIKLEIQPTYQCNNNCPFCLYGQFKSNTNTLSLIWLEENLTILVKSYDIISIVISGGEPSVLGDFYLELLIKLCSLYTKNISVCTNFKKLSKPLLNSLDCFNVSLHFNNYEADLKSCIDNIKAATSTGKSINIKTLDRSCKDNPTEIIELLNSLNIKSWEIIPYHHTEYLPFKFESYEIYESVIRMYLGLSREMRFSFQNKLQLDGILKLDNYNTPLFYITPNNKFAVQVFDNTNNFSLKEINDIEAITENYIDIEKSRDNYCSKCTSKLKCLANYFFNPNYKGKSCCGNIDLLLNKRGTK